jgi:hypothetical protein
MKKADTSFLRVPSLRHWGEIDIGEVRAAVEYVRKVAISVFVHDMSSVNPDVIDEGAEVFKDRETARVVTSARTVAWALAI